MNSIKNIIYKILLLKIYKILNLKKLIKLSLRKFSRVMLLLIPVETKRSFVGVGKIIHEKMAIETYEIFKDEFKKCMLFNDCISIREYAINLAITNNFETKESKNFF